MTVGANRIVRGIAIPNPVGSPESEPEEEFRIRKKLVEKGLAALCTEITEQTIFD